MCVVLRRGVISFKAMKGIHVCGRIIDRSQISRRIYFGFLQASIFAPSVDVKESQDRWAEDKGVWAGGSHSCLTLIKTKTRGGVQSFPSVSGFFGYGIYLELFTLISATMKREDFLSNHRYSRCELYQINSNKKDCEKVVGIEWVPS